MSKKIGGVVALAGLCALSLFLLSCGSSSSRPSGLLYVLTQGSNGIGNNVSSYSINLDSGGLSLVNSNASACPSAASDTNPSPCGAPLNILLNPTGANAFVLDQGLPCVEVQVSGAWECDPNGNTPIAPAIYPYTVGSDGSLSAPGTGVTWSCTGVSGSTCANSDKAVAMVMDPTGQFLFVINQGSYPSPGYPTPSSSNPSCPHAPANAVDVCPSISVFNISSTNLTLASGSPFYLSALPSALSVIVPPGSTTGQELLFVTGNQDICTAGCVLPANTDNTVSVYAVSSTGTLSEQAFSPYAIAAPNPTSVLAVNTNQTGQNNSGGLFVYVGNSDANGGDLNPFQVCTVQSAVCTPTDVQNNLMVPVGTCPQVSCNTPPSAVGKNPVAMVVDPTNNFLYSLSEGSNQVFAFKITSATGVLTALSPANAPTGSEPVALVLHPTVNNTGQFLYTSNSNSSNITGFALSTTSGSMSAPTTVDTPAAPSGMAAR